MIQSCEYWLAGLNDCSVVGSISLVTDRPWRCLGMAHTHCPLSQLSQLELKTAWEVQRLLNVAFYHAQSHSMEF